MTVIIRILFKAVEVFAHRKRGVIILKHINSYHTPNAAKHFLNV